MKYKICTRCNIKKPLNKFSGDKSNKDGLCYQCKDCANKISKEWYKIKREPIIIKNRLLNKYMKEYVKWWSDIVGIEKCETCKCWYKLEKLIGNKRKKCKSCNLIITKKYYQKNKILISKKSKLRYENNKEKILLRSKKWRDGHKELMSQYQKKYRQTEKGKQNMIKISAKRRRKLEWIKLLENPFPKEIKINWHHLNNMIVIPLPEITHRKCFDGTNLNSHREKCNEWIKEIYMINFNEILKE